MALEIVQGVPEPVQPGSMKRGYARFSLLRITMNDGGIRQFPKVSTAEPMTSEAPRVEQGDSIFPPPMARWACSASAGPMVRGHYAHFSTVEKLVLVVGRLCSIGTIARFGFGVEFPLLCPILGPLLLGAGVYLDHKRSRASRIRGVWGLRPLIA